MNLKDVMLSKIASHNRANTVWFHLYEVPNIVEVPETESRIERWGQDGRIGNSELTSSHKYIKLKL